MIQFPDLPADGQQFTAANGVTYVWHTDPGAWLVAGSLDGTTGSGAVVLQNSPVLTGDPEAPTPPADDNDTSIATTGWVQARSFEIINRNVIDMASLGLITNDSSLEVLAINNAAWLHALSQHAERGKATIIFPGGDIYMKPFATSFAMQIKFIEGLALKGMGRGVTCFKMADGQTGNFLSVSNCENVSVSDISIDNNYVNAVGNGTGLRIEALNQCYFNNIESRNARTYCLAGEEGPITDVWLENIYCDYAGRDCIDFKNWDDNHNRGIFLRNIFLKRWNMRLDRTQDCALDLRGVFDVDGVWAEQPGHVTAHGVRVRGDQGDEGDPPDPRFSRGAHRNTISNVHVNAGLPGDPIISNAGIYVAGANTSLSNAVCQGGLYGIKLTGNVDNQADYFKGSNIQCLDQGKSGVHISNGADYASFNGLSCERSFETGLFIEGGNYSSINGYAAYGCDSGFIVGSLDGLQVSAGSRLNNVTCLANVVRSGQITVYSLDTIIRGLKGDGTSTSSFTSAAAVAAGVGVKLYDPVGIDNQPYGFPAVTPIALQTVGIVAPANTARNQLGPDITIEEPVGLNAAIVVTATVSATVGAALKTLEIQLGTSQVPASFVMTTAGRMTVRVEIVARNATNAQLTQLISAIGADSNVLTNTTVNMASDQKLHFFMQKGTAGDVVTLESYSVAVSKT